MNASLLQRQAALAGVALLAALGAFALGGDDGGTPSAGEGSAVPPATEWRTAVVGVAGDAGRACADDPGAGAAGIVHPVLPCGAQIVLESRGVTVRTEVVGRGPVGLDREFDLTPALAERLRIAGTGELRWRFAE